MIWFIANTRSAKVLRDDEITSGSVGLDVEFKFSPAWDGLGKIAVFAVNGKRIDVHLNEDHCTVPPEVLTAPGERLTIGVYGAAGDGSIVIPTVYAPAGPISLGAEPSGIEPTPQTQPLIDQLLAATQAARTAAQAAQTAADEAERLAAAVQAAAERGEFDGEDGASAYEIAVEHGYTGTEAEWLESLHGQDATVDPTLTQAGEAADAAAAGAGIRAAQHSADYAQLFAATLNNGDGIPLDVEWVLGDVGGSRPYRAHCMRTITAARMVLQAADGYRFYVRTYADGSYTNSNWFGPSYSSRQTYTLAEGTDCVIVVGTTPEDTSVKADPAVYGAAITIVNNIGSDGGGSVTVDNALSGSSTNPVQNKVVKAALDGKYSKPASGIPKTDMDSNVQSLLDKAGTALQQHQDISGKLDKDFGVANAGKFLKVGADGIVVPTDLPIYNGGVT